MKHRLRCIDVDHSLKIKMVADLLYSVLTVILLPELNQNFCIFIRSNKIVVLKMTISVQSDSWIDNLCMLIVASAAAVALFGSSSSWNMRHGSCVDKREFHLPYELH